MKPTIAGDVRKALGIAIREHRVRMGLTQGQLAEHVDLSTKYVSEVERGQANPKLDNIELLAQAVGLNLFKALPGLRVILDADARLMCIQELAAIQERLDDVAIWLFGSDPDRYAPRARERAQKITEAALAARAETRRTPRLPKSGIQK